jgi:hypothetical protein
MFDQLGPWIDCLHAKDRKLHVDRGVPAGHKGTPPGKPAAANFTAGLTYREFWLK